MADFDLTQTDQQVQNILNDAQGAMGASAQTTLTTEYVMLKDTSGVYHKIRKSSFTEAIRDVLAGLLVNNDKGTTINQIAAIASGDFGSITPANLASVLGVFANSTTQITDFNTAPTKSGMYHLNVGNIQNGPGIDFQAQGGGWLLVFSVSDSAKLQVVSGSSLDAGVYIRSRWYSSNWSSWRKFSFTS